MPGKIEGTVVSITEQGDLVTDIHSDQLVDVPRDERVTVVCDEHETNGIFQSDHNEPPFTLLAVIGPQQALQLQIVDDSARTMLGVGEGAKVLVRWE